MTPFQTYCGKWAGCQRCFLHERRTKVVIARGRIPADIFFCGEAPGPSEDVLGQPFVGPAGHLLDRMVVDSGADQYRCCFGNLVCCIPLEEGSTKFKDPPAEAIEACQPHLTELVKLVKPRLVVLLGTVAEKNFPRAAAPKAAYLPLFHPAFLLRVEITQRALLIQRTTISLRDAVEDLA